MNVLDCTPSNLHHTSSIVLYIIRQLQIISCFSQVSIHLKKIMLWATMVDAISKSSLGNFWKIETRSFIFKSLWLPMAMMICPKSYSAKTNFTPLPLADILLQGSWFSCLCEVVGGSVAVPSSCLAGVRVNSESEAVFFIVFTSRLTKLH